MVAARIGVGIAFATPALWFLAQYWWTYRTTDGPASLLIHGMITSLAATIEYALTNPIESLIYSIGIYLLWKFAFGRRHDRTRRR